MNCILCESPDKYYKKRKGKETTMLCSQCVTMFLGFTRERLIEICDFAIATKNDNLIKALTIWNEEVYNERRRHFQRIDTGRSNERARSNKKPDS